MESQPQNAEFRNNPENFHPCSLDPDEMLCYCTMEPYPTGIEATTPLSISRPDINT